MDPGDQSEGARQGAVRREGKALRAFPNQAAHCGEARLRVTECSHTRYERLTLSFVHEHQWAPTFPANDVFATCGRDKRVKVWRVDHTNSSSATADDSIPAFPCAVTSIAFAPRRIRNKLVLAIGLEDGGISLVIGDPATSGPSAEVGGAAVRVAKAERSAG